MKKIHELVHRLHNPDLGILFIRIALAATFIHAGWLKLQMTDFVVTSFAQGGIPAFLAYFVMYAEFIGGILLLVGIFSRYVGIILAIIMLVAIVKVHFAAGYGLPNGYEYVLVLLLGALSVVTTGSGKYSLAGYLKSKRS